MSVLDVARRDRIVSFLQARAAEQLQFVIDLGHQNSYSYNKAGTERVAGMILAKIGHLFPVHRVVEQDEVGDLQLLSTVGEGESLYLLGHMDTVFPPDHPFQECHVDGEKLHGPGCGDMKAGLATIVYAVMALAEAEVLSRIPLTVILAGDEEIGAVTSRPVYEEERKKAQQLEKRLAEGDRTARSSCPGTGRSAPGWIAAGRPSMWARRSFRRPVPFWSWLTRPSLWRA